MPPSRNKNYLFIYSLSTLGAPLITKTLPIIQNIRGFLEALKRLLLLIRLGTIMSVANMTKVASQPERVMVRIPNMFVSFLAEPPRFNPNYDEVKAKSEAWISE